jgi:hypothetical protein
MTIDDYRVAIARATDPRYTWPFDADAEITTIADYRARSAMMVSDIRSAFEAAVDTYVDLATQWQAIEESTTLDQRYDDHQRYAPLKRETYQFFTYTAMMAMMHYDQSGDDHQDFALLHALFRDARTLHCAACALFRGCVHGHLWVD